MVVAGSFFSSWNDVPLSSTRWKKQSFFIGITSFPFPKQKTTIIPKQSLGIMGRTLVAQRSPRANVATTKCMIHWKIVNFYCSYGRKSYPWYILKKNHIRSWVNLIVDSTSNCRWLVSLRFLRSSDLPFRHGRTSRLPTSNQQRLGVLDVSSVLGGCIWKWRWRPYRKTEYM